VLSRFRGDAESIELRASVSGPATGPIELTVDGRVVGEVAAPPFRIRIPAEAGDHVAIARPKDPRAEVQIGTVHFSVR
jgi:penicillin-binding protein 1C